VIFWHISYQPFARYLSTVNVKATNAKTYFHIEYFDTFFSSQVINYLPIRYE
jgi:hypothetical protein